MTYFTNLVSPRQDRVSLPPTARIRTVTFRHPTLTPSHLSALTNIQTLQSVMGGGNKKLKVTSFSWDRTIQTSAAYMGQILQEEENEQNMSIFLTFTVTKCFDFFYLWQLSPKLQTALTGALDELEGNQKQEKSPTYNFQGDGHITSGTDVHA